MWKWFLGNVFENNSQTFCLLENWFLAINLFSLGPLAYVIFVTIIFIDSNRLNILCYTINYETMENWWFFILQRLELCRFDTSGEFSVAYTIFLQTGLNFLSIKQFKQYRYPITFPFILVFLFHKKNFQEKIKEFIVDSFQKSI